MVTWDVGEVRNRTGTAAPHFSDRRLVSDVVGVRVTFETPKMVNHIYFDINLRSDLPQQPNGFHKPGRMNNTPVHSQRTKVQTARRATAGASVPDDSTVTSRCLQSDTTITPESDVCILTVN